MKYHLTESTILEFKENLIEPNKLIKEVIAFCNRLGGKIIFGIRDDLEIKGLSDTEIKKGLEMYGKSIFESCTPLVIPHIYTLTVAEKNLLVVEISEGMTKPYFATQIGVNEGTFIRLGSSSVKANALMIAELQWRSRGRSPDEMPIYHADLTEINERLFLEFLNTKRKPQKPITKIPKEAWQAYGLILTEQAKNFPTIAGILAFGNQPQHLLHEAYIICSRFKGDSGRDAIESININGTIFEQFEKTMDFVLKHIPKSFHIRGTKRSESLLIPEQAIREVLINLIAHRNYTQPSPAKIAIFNNRIEFFSPGSFPGLIDEKNLESGISYIRNFYLTKILFESGLMEKMGSGFSTLFRIYRRSQLKLPQVIEGVGFVKVILPMEKSVNNQTEEPENQKILDYLTWNDFITNQETVRILAVSVPTAARYLKALVDAKKLRRVGKGPKTRYERL